MLIAPPAPLVALFEMQRQAFSQQPNPPYATRQERLRRLATMIEANENDIVQAIDADFGGRSAHETRLAEIYTVQSGIRHARSHLRRWMRARHVATDLQFQPGFNRLLVQPLGVVGIISPWNYPLQLSLGPALAAIAAGNRVLIKPSEMTPAFSALLKRMVQDAFTPDELSIVTGGQEIGQSFSALPFDHLFFTGSTAVGREVSQAAAANLTPVTLELGGKSPAILDPSCDYVSAAARIAYAKYLNAGQTCVAPDYLLVPAGQAQAVAAHLRQAIAKMYPTLLVNPDYTAIISQGHRQRLAALLEDARADGASIMEINPGDEPEPAGTRKMLPTLVLNASPSTRIMHEEIFGPILPIVEYRDLSEAIARVNRGARPLALYWFGHDDAARRRVLSETISGGVTINDCLWHLVQEAQPFGGVGASGSGAYHGKWGFDTFSKRKPVFYQARINGLKLLRPPYGKTFDIMMAVLRRFT